MRAHHIAVGLALAFALGESVASASPIEPDPEMMRLSKDITVCTMLYVNPHLTGPETAGDLADASLVSCSAELDAMRAYLTRLHVDRSSTPSDQAEQRINVDSLMTEFRGIYRSTLLDSILEKRKSFGR
jgi:hypothetical protein